MFTHCPYTLPFYCHINARTPSQYFPPTMLLYQTSRDLHFFSLRFNLVSFRFRKKKIKAEYQLHNQVLVCGQDKYCSVLQCKGLEQGNKGITRGKCSSSWTPAGAMYDFCTAFCAYKPIYIYIHTHMI